MLKKLFLVLLLIISALIGPQSVAANQADLAASISQLQTLMNWDYQAFNQAYQELESLEAYHKTDLKIGSQYMAEGNYSIETPIILQISPQVQLASEVNFSGPMANVFKAQTYIVDGSVYYADLANDGEWEESMSLAELESYWQEFMVYWDQYWPIVQDSFAEFIGTIPPQQLMSMLNIEEDTANMTLTVKSNFSAEDYVRLIEMTQMALNQAEVPGYTEYWGEVNTLAELMATLDLEISLRQNKENHYLETIDLVLQIAGEDYQKILDLGENFGDIDFRSQLVMAKFNEASEIVLPEVNTEDPNLPYDLAEFLEEDEDQDQDDNDAEFVAQLEEALELVETQETVTYQEIAEIFDLARSEEYLVYLSSDYYTRFVGSFSDGVLDYYEITLPNSEAIYSEQELLDYYQEARDDDDFSLDHTEATYIGNFPEGKAYTFVDTQNKMSLALFDEIGQTGSGGVALNYHERFADFKDQEDFETFKEKYQTLDEIIAQLGNYSLEAYMYDSGETEYQFRSNPEEYESYGHLFITLDKEGNTIRYTGMW